MMKVNVNDAVKVKLTEFGRRTHREHDDRIWSGRRYSRPFPYEAPAVDADGYSEFHLWQLMQSFGAVMFMGCPEQAFENNEIIFTRIA